MAARKKAKQQKDAEPGKGGKRSELDVLREQAQRVRRRFPKLFKYLAKRDEATFDLVKGMLEGIPDPFAVPPVKVKFVDEVIELLAPGEDCPVCRKSALPLLDKDKRDLLCFLCRTGIYMQGSGVRALARR